MPAPYLKSLSDKYGVPLTSLEKYWKEAKEAVKKSYSEGSDKFWGTVTKVFKNKINAHLNMSEDKMLSFKQFIIKESLEDDIAKKVINKIGDKISDTIEDDIISSFKDRILKKIQGEFESSDKEKSEPNGDEEDKEPEEGKGDEESKEPKGDEEPDGDEEDKEPKGDEEGEGDEEPEEPEEPKEPEIELSKDEEFIRKIAKDNNKDVEEILKLWTAAKKESKYTEKDNRYWNSVDKIFKKKLSDEFEIER